MHQKDERYDRGLLQGDSGTHSVTDSYDLNSFGSYADSDDEGHEVRFLRDKDDLPNYLAVSELDVHRIVRCSCQRRSY